MKTQDDEWLASQDPLMRGAYHTIKGVIAEKKEGREEPYYELQNILLNFAIQRRDILISRN